MRDKRTRRVRPRTAEPNQGYMHVHSSAGKTASKAAGLSREIKGSLERPARLELAGRRGERIVQLVLVKNLQEARQ